VCGGSLSFEFCGQVNLTMEPTMEFPPVWMIREATEFDTAGPQRPGSLGMEVLAQVRASGRFTDNLRVVIGGERALEAVFSTTTIFSSSFIPATDLFYQIRASSIKIRKNQTTSEWYDVIQLLKEHKIITSRPGASEEEDDNEDLITLLDSVSNPAEAQAAIRWAVCASEDSHLDLVLEALPASATVLNSKPILKG
jgi:hypothetical protein